MQTLLVLLPVLQHSDVKIAYRPITTVHSCLPIYFTHITQKYAEVYADLVFGSEITTFSLPSLYCQVNTGEGNPTNTQ